MNHSSTQTGGQMTDAVAAIIYPTVLLAEDSHDTRTMLKRAFELKGYEVFEAEDGQEAVDIARRYRPSLIVMDLNMPVLDGLEAVRNFRQVEEPGEQTPIVAITAYDVPGMEEAALKRLQHIPQQATRSGRTRPRFAQPRLHRVIDPGTAGVSPA